LASLSAARSQSGRPAIGAPGLPSAVLSDRQFDTLGYGCDTGPGKKRVRPATSKSES
jgi:hypothetical protein